MSDYNRRFKVMTIKTIKSMNEIKISNDVFLSTPTKKYNLIDGLNYDANGVTTLTIQTNKLIVKYPEEQITEINNNSDNLDFLLNEFEELIKSKKSIDSLEFILLSKILKLMKMENHKNADDERPIRKLNKAYK